MWFSKQLRLIRRCRQAAKAQQRYLMALELEGVVTLTLRSASHTLIIATERATGAHIVDTLREALRKRRQELKTEARQLRQTWQQSEQLTSQPPPHATPIPPAPDPIA